MKQIYTCYLLISPYIYNEVKKRKSRYIIDLNSENCEKLRDMFFNLKNWQQALYILLINLILIYLNLLQEYRVEANKIETNKMKHTTRKRLCNIVKRACFPFFIFLFGSRSNNTYWNVSIINYCTLFLKSEFC